MDVEQVELVVLGHLRHARGQGQIVGRVFEKGVIGDRHLVVEDAFFAPGKAERLRIGDEVHLVAAGRELNTEFRCDHATSAIGRITGDADLHFETPNQCTFVTSRKKPQIPPLRYAPVPRHAGAGGMTIYLYTRGKQQNCHPACPGVPWDRSVGTCASLNPQLIHVMASW